jgi:hypothetical protein
MALDTLPIWWLLAVTVGVIATYIRFWQKDETS